MKVKLLDESPVYEDKLGIHQKIAKLIRTIIGDISSQNECKKKNAIGLFGTWGSGKSTVINILEKDSEDLIIFRFDSWSHKDDLLRRTFLEKLADFLNLGDKPVNEIFERSNKREWKNGFGEPTVRDYLTSQVTEQHIHKHPEVKITSHLYITLSLLLISLIFSVISFFNFSSEIKAFFGLGIILFFTIGWFWREKQNLQDILSPFLGGLYDITEHMLSSESNDISSIRFQKLFKDLIKSWQEGENGRGKSRSPRIVVVLDNLDRVSNDTVLQFISLMQTALEASETEPEVCEKVIFVVPIDKKRLIEILGSVSKSSQNTKDLNDSEYMRNFQKLNNFAEDFVEKIFPYSVTIPTLVPTSWKEFFKLKFKEAFKGVEIDSFELELIIRVFQAGIRASKENLTPREIIHFINQMVVNFLYWNNETDGKGKVNFLNLAIFVALERYEPQILIKFETFNELEAAIEEKSEVYKSIFPYMESLIDKEKFLQDLVKFRFKTENTAEILYKDKIEHSLLKGDNRSVERIAATMKNEIFKNLLLEILNELQISLKGDIRSLGNCAYALEGYMEQTNLYTKQLTIALKKLIENPEARIDTLDALSGGGLALIIEHLEDDRVRTNLFERISDTLIRAYTKEGNGDEE